MLFPTRFLARAGSLTLLLLGGALWPACSSYSPADYCRDVCACIGCNELKLDGCIDDAEDLDDRATKAGCQDEADAVFACVGREGTCRAGKYDTDGCEQENAAADSCLSRNE